MKYDPVKRVLYRFVGTSVVLRKLFYHVLSLLFLREWHVRRALRRVMHRAPRPASILDAGVGFGQYTYFCVTRFPGSRVHGVDIDPELVSGCSAFFAAAGITGVSFAPADLTQPLPVDGFDIALSVDVLEHIEKDVDALRTIIRALKPGGRLIVSTPSNLGGSDVHAVDEESFIGEHARAGYDAEELRAKMSAAGFAVEHLEYTYGRWGSLAWRVGIKVPMLLLNRSRVFFLALPLYYLFVYPFVFLFMVLDVSFPRATGTGLLAVARKLMTP